MTPRKLTQRTAFRIAAIFCSLFLFTIAVIFAVLYQMIAAEIQTKLKSHITEIRDALVVQHDNEGLAEIIKSIQTLGPPTAEDEVIYLLTDQSGKYLAGNIELIPRFEGWKEIAWPSLRFIGNAQKSKATDALLAFWTPLKGGYLMVGAGDGDIDEAENLFIDGLIWGVIISLLIGLLGSTWLGIGAQRRMDALENTLASVAQGQLSTRVPLSGANDDLDHVSERVNSTLDHLQRTVSTLEQISTDIAHDLKTPIARIQQRVHTALAGAPPAEESRSALVEIRDELDGVITTFEALLRIAQIESGARKARFADIDIEDVVAKVVEAYEYVGEDTNHRISLRSSIGSGAQVHGDRDLLTQLLANLIENALRHTPEGSLINISVEGSAGRARVSVCDNGPGVPDAERERVFRRLYRLDKSRSTPGTGLGLSLVAAVAALHDASVELSDNEPGLAVIVEFPLV